mgnify:CR=1 FL=1
MSQGSIRIWIEAARPRTLPLALSSIGMGSFLAAWQGGFKLSVFVLSAVTTVLLQVLSNFANDYGDSQNGADSGERRGPSRAVQSGVVSPHAMKRAVYLTAGLSFLCGVLLLWFAFASQLANAMVFLLLGLGAIWAAYHYTAGKNPYGYAGFGDLFVLIFFGIVGVFGTYFLHTQSVEPLILLPALSCGMFSIAVLNVNNIRDIESDRKAGKFSIPVRIGRDRAVKYHWALLIAGLTSAVVYTLLDYQSPMQWIFLITLPLLVRNGMAVSRKKTSEQLDPFLKQMAITTLLFVLTFGVGLLFAG